MTLEAGAGIGAVALFLLALVGVWRSLGLGSLLKGTRLFLLDWFGEDARPGVEARPSFPERMASVEQRAGEVDRRTQALNHDLRGELTSRLTMLAYSVDRLHEHSSDFASTLTRLDERISEHRRRNDEQIALLAQAVTRNEEKLTHLAHQAAQRRAADSA